ncbi:unnamed protein product [Phytomonas sp. Hart1]|nr:unnamed protein product [Phytomonas sp. Hart1]|eukprot:CCW68051.1 unnamed protein product [Phytomonas sp. isolate Hart1]
MGVVLRRGKSICTDTEIQTEVDLEMEEGCVCATPAREMRGQRGSLERLLTLVAGSLKNERIPVIVCGEFVVHAPFLSDLFAAMVNEYNANIDDTEKGSPVMVKSEQAPRHLRARCVENGVGTRKHRKVESSSLSLDSTMAKKEEVMSDASSSFISEEDEAVHSSSSSSVSSSASNSFTSVESSSRDNNSESSEKDEDNSENENGYENGDNDNDKSNHDRVTGAKFFQRSLPVKPQWLALMGGSIVSELPASDLEKLRITADEVNRSKGTVLQWKAAL